MDDTRTRFLAAIATQLPADRIAEVQLFAAIRQGGVESGVAVIALEHEPAAEPVAEQESQPLEEPSSEELDELESQPGAEPLEVPEPEPLAEPLVERRDAMPRRYTICIARYRHTLKGPDRGKWEVTVTEDADAPLLTVDAVVRGVQRRSGDVDEIVRLSGDEVRAALPVAATP